MADYQLCSDCLIKIVYIGDADDEDGVLCGVCADSLKAELAAAREEIEHHKQKRIESMAERAKLRALCAAAATVCDQAEDVALCNNSSAYKSFKKMAEILAAAGRGEESK
jgi:hypothetical protein